jgi:transglutaminase-like putative cysteine protease
MGMMVQYKTTKEKAQRFAPGAAPATINSLIPLNYRIERPYDAEEAMYRITVKGDVDPLTAFARDGRQSIRDRKGNTIDMVVKATYPARMNQVVAAPAQEFLKSNYYINSDDEKVRQLARQAVGATKDPWQQSLQIERYVHGYITNKNMKEALATADEVARRREGDCTEHAMLAAAMCRAVGVPSRTALGLIYVDHPQRGPSMGFHMWTEVYVGGEWQAIDATLGRGFVGASHLKISDHSWHDEQGLKPLLPVLRVLGKLNIEVQWVQPRQTR